MLENIKKKNLVINNDEIIKNKLLPEMMRSRLSTTKRKWFYLYK